MKRPGDPFVGGAREPSFEYVDARATVASVLLRHMAPLADPDAGGEALLSMFEGFEPLLRPEGREALLDVIHAAGQVAAEPATGDALLLVGQLFRDQPEVAARVVGNLFEAKAILDRHPEATFRDGSTLVDDLLAVLLKISREPGLLEDVLDSLGDERSALLQRALPPLLSFRDRITYDRNALNGLPVNLTTGKGGAPETPVDRAMPNTGWNRSLFQRFLHLLNDGRDVTACNKEGAVLYAMISLDQGQTYVEAPYPFSGAAAECEIFKIEDLSTFYMRSMVGQARLHLRNEFLTVNVDMESMTKTMGIGGLWPTVRGEDVRPKPELLNRLVFFDVLGDSPIAGAPNYATNRVIDALQGPHIGTAACTERSIDDPLGVGDDVAPDGKIHGLRTCAPGQHLDERNGDTLFAFEYNRTYEAMAPLVGAFVKHGQEPLLGELLGVLNAHWSVEHGVADAEPALAEIAASDLLVSLGAMTRATRDMTLSRCAPWSRPTCDQIESVPAAVILADGLRALVDPEMTASGPVSDRRGNGTTATGQPLSLFALLRDAMRAQEAVLERSGDAKRKWLSARSRIADEIFRVDGRGDDAHFADPAVAGVVPKLVDLLVAQRTAECNGDPSCPALRTDLARSAEAKLGSPLLSALLDLVDVLLKDEPARRELGRMTSYLTRQDTPLVGAGGDAPSASSRPFATSSRGPGALDQSIAAVVDALGAIGDMRDIRPLYPVIAKALDNLGPQLSLLSRLNARAYDQAGHELCSRELDPEEIVRGTLSRLTLVVAPKGEPRRPALQIFLDAIADVNRFEPDRTDPLDADDYQSVFQNVHELLTDPTSGLEQLYASVRNATEQH
jgi:hypothetical protein